jgi:dipeptidase E
MRLLLLSSGSTAGTTLLEHATAWIDDLLPADVTRITFLPYASVTRSYDEYAAAVRPVLAGVLGREVVSTHETADPAVAIGGGNTWQLVATMRRFGLLDGVRDRVLAGAPYLGWSAGSNVACPTMQTTNDMPITDPGGFETLGLIGWQINPHYVHGVPAGFRGEAREDRILEYLALHPEVTVTGMREGTAFRVDDGRVRYLGGDTVRVFRPGREPQELGPEADVGFLSASWRVESGSS